MVRPGTGSEDSMQDLNRKVTILAWGSLAFAAVVVVGVFMIDDTGTALPADARNWLWTTVLVGVAATTTRATLRNPEIPKRIRPAMIVPRAVPFLLMAAARWINDISLARSTTVIAAAIMGTAGIALLRYRYQSGHTTSGVLR